MNKKYFNEKSIHGWGSYGFNCKKDHYYIDGKSLCGVWEFKGLIQQYLRPHKPIPNNYTCMRCHRKIEKILANNFKINA